MERRIRDHVVKKMSWFIQFIYPISVQFVSLRTSFRVCKGVPNHANKVMIWSWQQEFQLAKIKTHIEATSAPMPTLIQKLQASYKKEDNLPFPYWETILTEIGPTRSLICTQKNKAKNSWMRWKKTCYKIFR